MKNDRRMRYQYAGDLTTFERAGVTEYWVVDPEIDVIRVYRRAGDCFDRPLELSREGGDAVATRVLPGLELPLARLFND